MKKPTLEEIANYLTLEKQYDDFTAMGFADQFWTYYESIGWKVGKHDMKNWKAAIRTWEINRKNNGNRQTPGNNKPSGTSSARTEKLRNW